MKRKHIGADAVVLTPVTDDGLEVGVSPAADGKIHVTLTVTTDTLGVFVVPVTAAQLGVVVAVGKHLLSLDGDQAAAFRNQLIEMENNE